MGKTKKRYLANRILALILAAAMSITMIPQTALAAPADESGANVIVNDAADVNDDVPADGSTNDGVPVDGSTDVDVTAGGSTDGAETKEAAPAAAPTATYKISIGKMPTTAVYNGYCPFSPDEWAAVIKTVGDETIRVENEAVMSAWQVQGADGNFTALAGDPVNAGVYKLTLTCAAVTDVHDAITEEVTCTIEKAPLTITAKASAKPGAAADKASVTVAVDDISYAEGAPSVLAASDIVLTVTGVREAYGAALTAESKLEKNGDYVADVTASLKADASGDAKSDWNNFTVSPFTVDVEMEDLAETRINFTLADKWKDAGAVTRVYTKDTEAVAPAKDADYTYAVEYWDDSATPAKWTALTGAEVTGEWVKYDEDCEDENGKVKAPVNAGEYTYILTYEDTKEGKYAKSVPEPITVVIDPAPVTVEITNTELPAAVTLAGTKMIKVLSQVTYKATAKDDGSENGREINAKTEHIWGTGYDDKNVSQIYEPAFTLQIQNGSAWENIDDADYKLVGGKKYRVIYDGMKAIYNADGSYAHRTGINSGYDANGEEINGADSNYLTDETISAKTLEFEAQAGVEMKWDLTALYADGKAGKTVEEATAKEFDNTALYANRADYKNKVKLVGVTETSESINAVGSEFTYTWYKHNSADDLLDKQIWDQNKANGFVTADFYDDVNWAEWSESTGDSIIAPTDAGIYKLEISYQDNTDDGEKLHYVKADEKGNDKAAAYFIINKVALTITPEAGTYETLAGRTPYVYFVQEGNLDNIKYTVKKGAEDYTFPAGIGKVDPQWGVLENFTDESGVTSNWYPEDSRDVNFRTEQGYTYEIQAQNLGRRVYYISGDYSWFNTSIAKIRNNYTLYTGEKKETDVDGKKYADREEKLLSGKTALTVKPMGTTELTFEAGTAVAYEKTYDGKALTREEVKPETAYTLKANGQAVEVPEVEYLCVNKEDRSDYCMLEDLRNAGEYDLYVNFSGNETYKPLALAATDDWYGKKIGTVKIKQREITMSLDVDETYEAGNMSALWTDINSKFKVEGFVEDDEWAFSAESANSDDSQYNAWGGYPSFCVNKKGSKDSLYEGDILSRSGEFEIRYEGYLDYEYGRNYVVKNEAEVLDSFKTVAKPTRVESVSVTDNGYRTVGSRNIVRTAIDRDAATDDITQTYDVLEGIPYTEYRTDYTEMKGNLAAFKIYVPEEFDNVMPATAMYENEVEKIGGKVVEESTGNSWSRGYFIVLFNAAEGVKKVNIRWADKYVETIVLNFKESQCLGDLSKAVAPKSLAFNAAPKKLAVGESVQLDVKITKSQMTDVICLGYESSDETVMHVDPDSGYVTALKKGKGTTITVYPKQMDKDGKMVRIPNYKEVKVAIEGTPVTAPKSVKVLPRGNGAYVNYDRTADGYRREIYVVDNDKNPSLKKASDIETEVKKLHGNKNQWRGTFAIAPIYLDSADENYGRSVNGFWYKTFLSGLQTETAYTVYVRNVCEAKTLSDGYVITQDTVDASAAGMAVSFKSLKSTVTALDLKLDETDGVKDITGYTTIPEFNAGGDRVYLIDYAKASKGIDSTTLGMFRHNASEAAAESSDGIVKKLPLNDKNGKYQEPKLQYYVDGTDKKGNRLSKNDYVSVDKKGKIKLTGVGGWYDPETSSGSCPRVYVRDADTGITAVIHLWVVADVDSVTAKKKTMNLTVGQKQNLNDIALYSYKAGNSKLKTYLWPDMDMDAVRAAVKEQSEYFELVNGEELRAIKGGGTLKLSLTDKTVKKNAANVANATAEITFISKDLAQVKKIKAVDITNEKFGLTFTAAGYPDAFRVEIRDSSNNLLLDKRYTIYDENSNTSGKVYEVWERAKDKNVYVRVKDAYRIEADTIKAGVAAAGRKNRLAKESQYTVKITALYGNVASKEATAKVKTTKIPAVEGGLNDEDGWSWNYEKKCWVWNPYSYNVLGGMSIQVAEYNEYGIDWKLDDSNRYMRVLSGNSYTLTAEPTNRGRVNDTLVWTVGDKKVATVKAAAGTYCITLKGMQPGSTTLEVKSKILNKTIARYVIYVAAVGDAYGSGYRYFGDDEPENLDEEYNQGHYGDNAPDYLPLSVDDRRKTTDKYHNDSNNGYGYYSLFSFTAPETGRYNFTARNSYVYLAKKTSKNSNSWQGLGNQSADLGWMQEGQTVYLKSSYGSDSTSYYVEIGQTERMEAAADGATVTGQGKQEIFEFKAPKDGIYRFTLTSSTENAAVKEYLYLYTNFNNISGGSYDKYDNDITYELQKDETVWLKTDYLTTGKTCTLGAKDITPTAPTAEEVTVPANGNAVYAFTADAAGIYRLAVTAATANATAGEVTLRIYNDAMAAINGDSEYVAQGSTGTAADGKTPIYVDMLLEAGQTVYLRVANASAGDLAVGVTGTKDDSVPKITADGTDVALTASQAKKALFTAQETGIYTFSTNALEQNVTFEMRDDTRVVSSGSSLSKKLAIESGKTIVVTMTAASNVNVTLKAELTGRFAEISLGQGIQVSILSDSEAPNNQATAAGFIFTAPKEGTYSFWSEGSYDTYGILYDIAGVDAETYLLYDDGAGTSITSDDDNASGNNFGISWTLRKDQTVYLKSRMLNSDVSGSFTVHVAEDSNAWYN